MDSTNSQPIPNPQQNLMAQTPLPPKKFNWVYIIIALVFIILAVLFITPLFNPNTENDIPKEQAVPTQPEAIPTRDFTGNWKEYTNPKYDFSLKYPQDMTFSIDQDLTPRQLIEGISEGATFSRGDQALTITAGTVTDYYKAYPLARIVQTGSLINSCYEDDPVLSETFTSAQGDKGMKASYWIQQGCQGAAARTQSPSHIFFYKQAATTTIVEITSENFEESIDQVATTFTFAE